MKMLLTSVVSILFLILVVLAWCGFPWTIGARFIGPGIVHVEPEGMVNTQDEPNVIKILTWNISYLFGKGSEGPGYERRMKSFYEGRLDQLVTQIKDWQPDVICFQEVDFDSARSHGINQAQYVAKKAGYPYVAEVASWEANYIPFPYWPLKHNFGRMKSGGAILSRFPITQHEVALLAKPQSHPWWYNVFYLHRYFQQATIEVGSKKFSLVNLHLEAFDKIDRKEQVIKLISHIKTKQVDFVAGDFNMVPESATKKSKFFESEDDYENDPSYELMRKSGFLEVIPDEIYTLAESSYFTFPAWKPDRRLDYIFYKSSLKMMKAEVLSSALSDHLPLRASFQIGSPKINPYSL